MMLCLFVHLVHLVHLLLLSVFSMSCVPHFAQIASIKFCVFLYHCVPIQSSINTACFWFSSLLCVIACVSLSSSSKHYQCSLPLLLLTSSQSSHLPRSAPDDFLHTTAHCFNQSLITSQIYLTSFINWPSISQLSKLLTKQL